MSLLARIARPAHPVGRAYSSFFSSKPGGGRHFVSAKPPKPVLQPGRAKVDTTTSAASPTESTATSPPTNASRVVKAASADEKLSSKPAETHPQSPLSSGISPPFTYSSSSADHVPIHPTVSSKEYKLHQFFSLHRPLLLLDHPTSAIFEASDPSTPLFTSSEDQVNNNPWHSITTIDNPPESSPDADADAARQLAHALVMNRVGDAVAWQQALSRLGLSAKYSEDDMTLAKETAQEWVTIHADSTRRKKRKKMKKHK
ncbi:hypothetical protein JVT61DRAFT_2197 [Boletus reticuloceps]|uniref:Uncharacterized protein n=1 Tax=Boletus reticuloceps TaxID=495285 RepID=A0A8I2YT02_9AGAM|nr:hypothetical protein JVT61DRAFT_2197 [Boletus reticuloceps]